MGFVFPVLVLAAMVFAVVDIILRDESQVRHMPKALWLMLVILVPLVGVVLWFVLGRERSESTGSAVRMPRVPRAARSQPPAQAQPPLRPRDTRSTEQQLADLEREIEQERLRAAQRRAQQDGQSAG